MYAQSNHFKKKKAEVFPLALIFENLLLSCRERCQMVSPASWSDHMLPIKAEGHAAGQQLNVGYQHGTSLVMG